MKDNKTVIKRPLFWMLAALLLAAAALAYFVIVPGASIPVSAEELYGNYRFEKQVYMNGLSSFLAGEGYVQYYTLTKDSLTISEASGEQHSVDIGYRFSAVSEQDFKAMFMFDIMKSPDIAQYKLRYQCTLCEPAEYSPGYTLYLMDNEIWLARVNCGRNGVKYIWSIYSIQTYTGILPIAPETTASIPHAAAGTEIPALFDAVYLELYLGEKYIHRLNLDDDIQKRAVEDAIMNSTFKEASFPASDINTLEDYIAIHTRKVNTKEEVEFYVFEREGRPFMQSGGSSVTLDDGPYTQLKEVAFGYCLPDAMTVVAGEILIHAFGYTVGSIVMGAEPQYLKPRQVADHLMYLNIFSGESTGPFIPYIDGKEVYGQYKLYDKDFNEVPFFVPSCLAPQTYIFHDAIWPGTYIVELETDEDGILMQYFFGVILSERPEGLK